MNAECLANFFQRLWFVRKMREKIETFQSNNEHITCIQRVPMPVDCDRVSRRSLCQIEQCNTS